MRITKLKEKVIALISIVLLSSSCSDDNPVVKSLWEAGKEKNKIVVISDLHLGIDDSFSETVENRKYLIEFLQRLQTTKDVRELVIAGDFLDEWFMPYSYTKNITDEDEFYRGVVKNNQSVIDEMKRVIKSGIKLVYVPGNHDLTVKSAIIAEAIPGITQVTGEPQGVGTYYTGDRKEIAIEHGHRYDPFSAPDCVTNKELCGNDKTILPAGFFYAINGATWLLEGTPHVDKQYPKIEGYTPTNIDEQGAYSYYNLIYSLSNKHTTYVDANAKLFNLHFAGFDDNYSFMDFMPQMQKDGTISGKLYKNIQRTWDERQTLNKVKVKNTFLQALRCALNPVCLEDQARAQYLENPNENVEVVVFGHTHIPDFKEFNGKLYLDEGTWVDHNTIAKANKLTRTFAIVTTGTKDTAALYVYGTDGSITDITEQAKEVTAD